MEEQNLDQVTENPVEQHTEQQDVVQQPQPTAHASHNEQNIRKLREKADRADQLERELRAIQEQQKSASQEDFLTFGDDELVEGKHLKRAYQKMKNDFEAYKQQSSAMTAEARLKSQYSDFDTVVTPDTIATLRDEYPEIAATITSNKDMYTQAVAAYTLIKKLYTIPQEQYSEDKNRIQSNAAKPRPVSSMSPQSGESPISRANAFAGGLTPDLKKQLFKEMQESKKNR
jgi:hypothetical protein